MALQVIESSRGAVKCQQKDGEKFSLINYEKLAALVGDPKISYVNRCPSIEPKSAESRNKQLVPIDHKTFMSEYRSIFLTEGEQREERRRLKMVKVQRNKVNAVRERLPSVSDGSTTKMNSDDVEQVSVVATGARAAPNDECAVQDELQRDIVQRHQPEQHDVEQHILKIRKSKIKRKQPGRLVSVLARKDRHHLEKLLTRMPYDRPYEDSMKVLEILRSYEPIARQMPLYQLKELAITATVERYDDVGVIVFAGSGFHVVLRGSVKPLSTPHVEFLDEADMPPTARAALKAENSQRRKQHERHNNHAPPGYDDGDHQQHNQQENKPDQSQQPQNLLAELLHEHSQQSLLPPIEEDGSRETVSNELNSRKLSRQRVSFVDSAPDYAPVDNNNDRQQTADSTDTFEQLEAVRVATLEASERRSVLSTPNVITVGECFGTLRWRGATDLSSDASAMLCRVNEPKTVLLKLSATSYDRISRALTQRQLDKKVNLISTCEAYRYWSRLSLEHLARCAAWVRFPPGTVLASEGEICPYAGYLLAGECRIARRIFVKETDRKGEELKRRKEVIMGTFLPGHSFGEKSLMANEPMGFTLITVTKCELAVINDEAIRGLENGVKQLLAQIDATGPSLEAKSHVEDDIYNEYIKQESDRRWTQYRLKVVQDVINYQGIMPGYGRWTKN